MATKVCGKCEKELDVLFFTKGKKLKSGEHKLSHWCRDCQTEYARQRRAKDPEKFRKYDADRRERNKEENRRTALQYYYDHHDARLAYRAIYYERHKAECVPKTTAANKIRYHEDLDFRLGQNLRARMRKALKTGNGSGSVLRRLGCTISELQSHLESKFQPGMSWDNYGHGRDKWNIDHIIPLRAFDLSQEQHIVLACHYLNLQPLWQPENFSKKDRY